MLSTDLNRLHRVLESDLTDLFCLEEDRAQALHFLLQSALIPVLLFEGCFCERSSLTATGECFGTVIFSLVHTASSLLASATSITFQRLSVARRPGTQRSMPSRVRYVYFSPRVVTASTFCPETKMLKVATTRLGLGYCWRTSCSCP